MRELSRHGDLSATAAPQSRSMDHPDNAHEAQRVPITFGDQLEAAFANGQRLSSITPALGLLPVDYAVQADFGSFYAWIQLNLPLGFLGEVENDTWGTLTDLRFYLEEQRGANAIWEQLNPPPG